MSDRAPDTAAQFSRRAEAYVVSPTHVGGEDLELLAAFAAARPDERALDIATGPGHTAFRIAAAAGFVVGIDIAPGMIAAARRSAAERGAHNVVFHLADAHALPFPPRAFELVTCRIAPHHFHDLHGALAEVARVLKPGGRFVVEDSLAPESPEVAAFLDALERRRDPTHVRSLDRAEWLAACAASGLAVVGEAVCPKVHDFDLWVRRTGLGADEVAAITAEILAASEAVRAALFDIAGERVLALRDEKLLLRAEPRAG